MQDAAYFGNIFYWLFFLTSSDVTFWGLNAVFIAIKDGFQSSFKEHFFQHSKP